MFDRPIEVMCVNDPLLTMILSGIALCYFLGSLQSKRQCACENYEEYDCSESEEGSLRHA